MIPESMIDLTLMEEQTQPSKTYQLDLSRKRITTMVDGQEAIIQAVQKILYTERYAYVIYSSQYGVELDRLIGKDYDFIKADIQRTIEEALFVDDRILSLSDFEMEKIGLDKMAVTFIVHSIEGDSNMSMEVTIV